MKNLTGYKASYLLMALLIISAIPVSGADNFLINGQKNATVAVYDSFTVSFDFGAGDTLAHVMLWLDVNHNGLVDSLVDMMGYSSEHSNEPLIDGGPEDMDFQRDGSFLLTIDDFWNIADMEYIFVVYDNGGSDMANLMVEQIQSSFSISGKVEQPPNQAFLFIEARPNYMYPAEESAGIENRVLESAKKINELPMRSILSKTSEDPEYDSYAAVTDSTGAYTIYVPDDMAKDWEVSAFDFWNLIPGYVPPEPETVWVDGMITEVNFSFSMARAMVEGRVLDNMGQVPMDDGGHLLNFSVGARNNQTGMWINAQVDSGYYRIFLTEGDFDIIVYNVMPFYLRPYEQWVSVGSSDTLRNIDFTLYPVDEQITGRVTEFGTNPVQYIEVVGYDNGYGMGYSVAQTDMDGNYSLPVSSQVPTWNLQLRMDYYPPDMMVEGGNSRQAAPGDQHVDFNIVRVTPEPRIEAIKDIPHDQGLQVRVTWKGSAYDTRDYHGMPILQYSVWRLTPRMLLPDAVPAKNDREEHGISKSALESLSKYGKNLPVRLEDQDFIWDFITTVPAIKLPIYSYVSPTLGDSTMRGIHWSYFVVVAHASDYYSFFYSENDSGYSVDNLAPPAPVVVAEAVPMAVELRWEMNPHPDVIHYSIFRSETAGFTPSQENLIAITQDCYYRDNDVSGVQAFYYRVAVEDDAFNRSISDQVGITTTDVALNNLDIKPASYKLGENFPNPFNPSTEIAFQIPQDGMVNIKIYNVLGEQVKTLTSKFYRAGFYTLSWNGKDEVGNEVFSGIYFYHMESGNFRDSGKMILAR